MFKEEMLPFLLKESLDYFIDPVFAFSSFCESLTALDRISELLAIFVLLNLRSSLDGVL
jgi:hypothetical protein